MSANDGLKYPANFQEFMGVVSRWHGAREAVLRPGEGVGDMLLRTAHELDDAVVIFRQVWELADAARHGAGTDRLVSNEKESDTALLRQCLEIINEAQCDPGRSVEYRRGYFDAYNEVRQALEKP